MTTSPFFTLLPADLQLDILFVWLQHNDGGNGLLRVLSAIDMACCSRSIRKPFLWLIAQIPAFGELTSANGGGTKFIATFLLWLSSRKVALMAVQLEDCITDHHCPVEAVLPFVEHIYWTQLIASGRRLEEVLLCCPNVLSIECKYFLDLPAEFMKEYVTNLKEVTVHGHRLYLSGFFGCHHLRVLRLEEYSLSLVLGIGIPAICPLLETIQATIDTTGLAGIVETIQSCAFLRELILHGCWRCGWDADGVVCILAFQQIKRLTLGDFDTRRSRQNEILFADMLELRPDLEVLQIDGYRFSSDGHLCITGTESNITVLTKVFNNCSSIGQLTLDIDLTSNIAELIAAHDNKSRLRSLTAWCPSNKCTPHITILFSTFGLSLTYLELHGYGVMNKLLHVVSNHCPLLESLCLRPKFAAVLKDTGMIAIVKGCPQLLHLTLLGARAVTIKTLQAMVDHRLHLKTLKLQYVKAIDSDWLRQQYRDQQMLPVPNVLFS